MKKRNLNRIEKVLEDDLKNYENMGLNDEDKAKSLVIIAKTAQLIANEEEANKKSERDEYSRQEAERRRQLDEERFEFEQKRFEFEVERFKAEQKLKEQEVADEAERRKYEKKRDRVNLFVTIAGIAVPAVLGFAKLFSYVGLTKNAQRHDYDDYQPESSNSKENRNNILKN